MFSGKKSTAFRPLFRLIACAAVIALCLSPAEPAFAAHAPRYEQEAADLSKLGLFRGTSRGFELDRPCDRVQAAVLFLRLLGEEDDALQNNFPSPFEDVTQSWAKPYVGYMFQKGYTRGSSPGRYGTGPVTADEFSAFILRALGYRESAGDFSVDRALEKMQELNLLQPDDFNRIKEDPVFYRDYAALLLKSAYNEALSRGRQLRLPSVPDGTLVSSYEDMQAVFRRMHGSLQNRVTLQTSGVTTSQVTGWLEQITATPSADVYGWSIVADYANKDNRKNPSSVHLSWHYNDGYLVAHSFLYPETSPPLSERNQLLKKAAQQILETEINDSMSQEEKIKAIHDYIIRTTSYDLSVSSGSNPFDSDAFHAYGVLINHEGVCDGYSKAFDMFMDILGIPAERAFGTVVFNGRVEKHAWNRVTLNGKPVFLDLTWNDPTPDQPGRVLYNFYMIPEEQLAKTHQWNRNQFRIQY